MQTVVGLDVFRDSCLCYGYVSRYFVFGQYTVIGFVAGDLYESYILEPRFTYIKCKELTTDLVMRHHELEKEHMRNTIPTSEIWGEILNICERSAGAYRGMFPRIAKNLPMIFYAVYNNYTGLSREYVLRNLSVCRGAHSAPLYHLDRAAMRRKLQKALHNSPLPIPIRVEILSHVA